MQPRCGILIPIQEAITNAADRIQNPILHLTKQDITDLLTVTLNNMYFSFNGQVFRPKEGLPMGSSISGIMAILFMDRLETDRPLLTPIDKPLQKIC